MTWRGRNIYLTGIPGAGKSAIGIELQKLLLKSGYDFVDLDSAIERRVGKRIHEIFELPNGEREFRKLETSVLLDLSHRSFSSNPLIVATGGGSVMRQVNRAIMRGTGVVVWIDVNVKQASRQVLKSIMEGNPRPLLISSSPEELTQKLRSLHGQRLQWYEQTTLHFVIRDQRGTERTPPELAGELLLALNEMSRHVKLRPRFHTHIVHSALGEYSVEIGSGIAASELALTIRDMKASRVAILTDKNVSRLSISRSISKLAQEFQPGVAFHQITLEAGEDKKSYETLTEILESLFKIEMPRKGGLLVTLGGGVIGDVGGLAASIYKRGIPLIHIPTSLLSQVDASIGGKTGIDYYGGKNTIGTFYPPSLVLIDPLYLKSLDKRELHSGLAEVFKYALIGSRPMWDELSKSVRRLIRGVDSSYESIIRLAVQEKIRYIERDEFERHAGIRELLNFGHTVGHALESATAFRTFSHGEAVLLGMRAAAWLSNIIGMLSEDEWREIEIVLGRLPVAATTSIAAADVISALNHDKKRAAGRNRFVLLKSIGEATMVDNLPEAEVREAVEFMLGVI